LSNYGSFTDALTQEIVDRATEDTKLQQQLDIIYKVKECTKEESGVLVDKTNALQQQLDNLYKIDESTLEESGVLSNKITPLQEAIDNLYKVDESTLEESGVLSEKTTALQQQLNNIYQVDESTLEESGVLINKITPLQNAIEKAKTDIEGNKDTIDSNVGRLNSIETQLTTSVVRNDYEIGVDKTYVAKIVFIKPDVENNLTAEQVYEALVAAGQIDNNTLYLIQEEE
jgi:chromosome segregation ATPase